MSKDIRDLITDMAAGDINALGRLYDIMSVRIFNYARMITQSRELAEDVTHDVFLQLYKKADRIAGVSDQIAYIMVMTRNYSYNQLKRERQAAASLEDVAEVSDYSSPFDHLLFEDIFACLPASQREAVYLHLLCGFPHKDIARIQNVPLVTVKWRYGKALARMRENISQDVKEDSYEAL